ncbi:MAG: hypothetical protein J2P58_06735 [Acidimicrobiaceae bacterium]|nr:hypothetical protein [Acidimicrobiaceae bacterium]
MAKNPGGAAESNPASTHESTYPDGAGGPAGTGGNKSRADPAALRRIAAGVMELHWRDEHGYTVPHSQTYPWLWLWDSCFHALIWDALDDERAVRELTAVFRRQSRDGFIPHMANFPPESATGEMWGATGRSAITQPPMYGHALAVLASHGRDIRALAEPALRGLQHLFDRRRAPCGLIRCYHPWETGADDSPRFDFGRRPPYYRLRWDSIHYKLVGALEVRDGEATGSSAFDVCPAGFNALVAWNARELAEALGDSRLSAEATTLAQTIDALMWSEEAGTWCDVQPDGSPGSSVQVVDALLPALVTADAERAARVLALTTDPDAFGLPFGPAQVHPAEASYEEDQYWRGPAWPCLTYLLWRAAEQRGLVHQTERLAAMLRDGAAASGFAEYWNAATGAGRGAIPQSWACLAILPSKGSAQLR